jgi:hypothetical protein
LENNLEVADWQFGVILAMVESLVTTECSANSVGLFFLWTLGDDDAGKCRFAAGQIVLVGDEQGPYLNRTDCPKWAFGRPEQLALFNVEASVMIEGGSGNINTLGGDKFVIAAPPCYRYF